MVPDHPLFLAVVKALADEQKAGSWPSKAIFQAVTDTYAAWAAAGKPQFLSDVKG